MRDIIWICWVLIVGLREAYIKRSNPDIYLLIEEEGWKVTRYDYSPDKHKYRIEDE